MEIQTREHSRQMFQMIEAWQQSGISKKQFYTEMNIPHWKFFYWQKKYREDQSASEQNCFVPVKTGKQKFQNHPCIEIHYPNGVRLQLPAGTGLSVIRAMIGLR